MEVNLLYPKFTTLFYPKNSFRESSKIIFDLISEHSGPAKSINKINHNKDHYILMEKL